ncbi:MAG: G protein-coupled seven transmembrane receptor [Monoraphidium minutum]|nr:MAG: G protein-coupled seven transmembrane receptor [Monoraphidium minutum]
MSCRGPCSASGAAARAGALLLLLGALLPLCHAKVTYTSLFRDDRSLIPVAPSFAFGDRGKIDVKLRDISIWQRHEDDSDVDYSNFGFMLIPVVQPDDSLERSLAAGECPLGREGTLFTLDKPPALNVIKGGAENGTFHIDVDSGGWFFLYFANCGGAAVSLRARIALYNMRDDGGRDYMSIGETELDAVYWIMFALFAGLTAAWCAVLAAKRPFVHKIHLLMGGLLMFKTLTLLAQALMVLHIERNGEAQGWNVVYYVFTTARGLLFFTVAVLIGAGWSYMKPFMDDNTRTALMVVVPLQVFANIALVFVDEESPAMRDWLTWTDLFHFVDVACCCAILFPIVTQIKHLREAAEVDGKAARMLTKLRLFRTFYVVVVGYIYFTRIIVFLLKNTVDYSYMWLTDAAAEVAALAFYTWVGVSFRPTDHNVYLKLDAEDMEMAAK